MIKLSKDEAYAALSDTDKKVIEYELDSLHSQAANAGKEMTYEFFQEDDAIIALVVSWNGEQVELYRFEIEGKLLNVVGFTMDNYKGCDFTNDEAFPKWVIEDAVSYPSSLREFDGVYTEVFQVLELNELNQWEPVEWFEWAFETMADIDCQELWIHWKQDEKGNVSEWWIAADNF